MLRLSFPKLQLISPTNPVLRIEQAIDCDGSECGRTFFGEDGFPMDLPPHDHLVESQEGAGTRTFAVGGSLPSIVDPE
jgi:hypothetical protein